MGYNIYITKANNYWESDENPIVKEEILDLVEKKPEFKLKDGMTAHNPLTGEEIYFPGQFIVCGKDGEEISMQYTGKKIIGGHFQEEIKVLKEIAEFLNANVQGDEGEFY